MGSRGGVCTRAIVSARIPPSICLLYHAPERTLGVPKSPECGYRRAGRHNSLTRVRLKPFFMIGGECWSMRLERRMRLRPRNRRKN
jgi:nitrate reductase / nitrite oxidoreductase, alpha subunit